MPTPERAFLHRLRAPARASGRSCSGVGIDVAFAQLVLADGGRADEGRDVERDALRFEEAADIRRASSIRSDI